MRDPNVFIVVLNWNNYEDSKECLQSLTSLNYKSYQIVLVDNGSTDGSAQRLQKEFPYVHTIINKENLGFAAGCNVGIKYSLENGANAVLLINNDAILEPQSLGPAVETLFSDSNIGIIGGKIKEYNNPAYIQSTGVKYIIWPIMSARTVGAGELDKGQFDNRDERVAVSGSLMLVKREVFEAIGLLSEELFFGCEDIDFCLRARKYGFKIIYEPRFVSFHKGGGSSGARPRYIYNYFLSRQLLMKRHLSPWLWKASRALFSVYVKYYWYKRFIKKEKLNSNVCRGVWQAVCKALRDGYSIDRIDRRYLKKYEEVVKKISVVRIGDQFLYWKRENDKDAWFAPGYYQLREIADMFESRLALFTAFGRLVQIEGNSGENNTKHLYRIPAEFVPQFKAVGPQVKQKGLWPYLRALPKLVGKLRKVTTEHDVSWLMMPSLAGLVGSLVAPKHTLKVVQLVGEWSMPLRIRYPRLAPLVVPLAEWLTRLALRRADLAVFVSNCLKQKYGQKLKCQVMVANESRLRPWMIHKVDRWEVHRPLRVLYVGRLVPEKGVQFLLEAVALIAKEMPCELWIAGNGPFEPDLRAKAEELKIISNVRWLGRVPWGKELFELMRQCDIFVLPSLGEGLPLTIVEAMSQSLPIIASRVGGIPEIVKDNTSGILVEPGNSLAIARAIRQVATNAELRQKLVTEGLRVARENTVEAQTGRVIKAICQLVDERN